MNDSPESNKRRKSLICFSLILSTILPGSGQIYNFQFIKGASIFILVLSAIYLGSFRPFDTIILDDGYQDLSIFKNLSIVCFNESEGVGNKQIIPAGPLRESLNSLSRADIVFIKGKKNNNFEKELKTFNQNIDIFYFNYEILNKEIIKDKKIIAFAGIGSNNNFFNLLTENNFNIFMTKSFPDHHLYKEKELDDLIKLAKENEALLLTTEKDYNRIKNKYYNDIKSVVTKINIVDKNKFVGVLQKII